MHEENLYKYDLVTPITKIKIKGLDYVNLFVKLEYFNRTGSVKDRAAQHIIKKLINLREIDKDTTIIESSSGNFGIALSLVCREHGLKFICVFDPNISPVNQLLIENMCSCYINVTERDENNGYLLSRIKKVKELKNEIENSYWINQYANPYNAEAYYNTLGDEICHQVNGVDYVFVGVSSGGTITGVSQRVKDLYPNAKIIAVDVQGSVIFGGKPGKRYIPGIGSAMVPDIIKYARIDDVVIVDEIASIKACKELLREHMVFAGGSSGTVYAAIKKYFHDNKITSDKNVVTIFADRGDRYASTIYNDEWVFKNYNLKI